MCSILEPVVSCMPVNLFGGIFHGLVKLRFLIPLLPGFGNCPLKGFSWGFPVCSCLTCLCTMPEFPQRCHECMVTSGTRRPQMSCLEPITPALSSAWGSACWAPSIPTLPQAHQRLSPHPLSPPPTAVNGSHGCCSQTLENSIANLALKIPQIQMCCTFPFACVFFIGMQKQ